MHSPTLTLHQLRQLMQRFGYDVCQECAARYVPCVALTLQYDKNHVAHIMPAVYSLEKWGNNTVARRSFPYRLCDGIKPAAYEGRFVAIHRSLDFRDFVESLLQRYPELVDKPWTAELLRQTECDLIAEIAMWQFARD
jgi:hypothetical protein